MIIIKLSGGLGNQMFQYAFGRQVSYNNKVKLLLDTSFFQTQQLRKFELDVFSAQYEIATNQQCRVFNLPPNPTFPDKIAAALSRLFFKNPIILESGFSFSSEKLDIPPRAYIEGYFQSEKYFAAIKEIIRKDFTFITPMSADSSNIAGLIADSNSVSIHVRRGDYILNQDTHKIHGVCSTEYYQKAIDYMNQRVKNAVFFIFSDDVKWAKENIDIKNEKYYIDFNGQDRSHEDLQLMSLCEHNIIANSSFSWWGAWLNNNPEKIIISPRKWFNDSSKDVTDLIPESWIRM